MRYIHICSKKHYSLGKITRIVHMRATAEGADRQLGLVLTARFPTTSRLW